MARRRFTVKRIDPWSVLKFGALANVALLGIFLLVMAVVWFIVDRLMIVDQLCGIAADIGFSECGLSGGNLFRAAFFLGLLWVVVQTAVVVFLAFLHNLIADLTGGVVVAVLDEAIDAPSPSGRARPTTARERDSDATAALAAPAPGSSTPSPGGAAGPTARRASVDDATRRAARRSETPPRRASGSARSDAPRRRSDGDELFGGR